MMDNNLLKNLLSYLNRHAFAKYVFNLHKLRDSNDNVETDGSTRSMIDLSEQCGEYVFEEHRFDPPEFQGFTGFVIYTEPIDLFYKMPNINIASPAIVKNLRRYKKLVMERIGSWFFPQDGTFVGPHIAFVTNYAGIDFDDYQKVLFPKFCKLVANWSYRPEVFLGSIDSFLELNPTNAEKAFSDFVSNQKDGLSISLVGDRLSVDNFVADRYIPDGVLRDSKTPCESIFVNSVEKNQALLEFEQLINRNPKENELERFLQNYYQDVFGFEYDRIETQLWLRFPELDVAQGERRLDIFLRNSIEKDWELYEVKRATKLTRSYRDIPTFRYEVLSAIQQLRNYRTILSQDNVKRKMANEGIEYYVPSLKLVIGRSPAIPLAQWRWLKSSNENDVKILTYDELLESMKKRVRYHAQFSQGNTA